jgi:hypothetical protein
MEPYLYSDGPGVTLRKPESDLRVLWNSVIPCTKISKQVPIQVVAT